MYSIALMYGVVLYVRCVCYRCYCSSSLIRGGVYQQMMTRNGPPGQYCGNITEMMYG
jgi:hypothetical protein